jgi:hypothetical protein
MDSLIFNKILVLADGDMDPGQILKILQHQWDSHGNLILVNVPFRDPVIIIVNRFHKDVSPNAGFFLGNMEEEEEGGGGGDKSGPSLQNFHKTF